jgi:mannose-6-phosphate isomerase-like protein (cupin superfamily)/GNAT superfamily N-acetyltransferase
MISRANAPHYTWGSGCDGWRLVDTPGLSVIEERMPPATAEVLHLHAHARQLFRVLSGVARFELPDGVAEVRAGEALEIAPRLSHRIRNDGPEPLELVVVSQPTTRGDRVELEAPRAQGQGIEITTDPGRVDPVAAHAFLRGAYWSEGIPLGIVQRAIAGSVCAAALDDGRQVGFARVVTDRATFAYLCDVYVLESHRGRGLATRLVRALLDHPELQGLRRWVLVTRDAHAVYAPLGFRPLAAPEGYLEITRPGLYLAARPGG